MEIEASYICLDVNYAFISMAKARSRWKPRAFHPAGMRRAHSTVMGPVTSLPHLCLLCSANGCLCLAQTLTGKGENSTEERICISLGNAYFEMREPSSE